MVRKKLNKLFYVLGTTNVVSFFIFSDIINNGDAL